MPPLIVVQNDREYVRVIRQGRFPVPREVAASAQDIQQKGFEYFPALAQFVRRAQEDMIKGLESLGYKYSGKPFELVGPQSHIVFSDDRSDDPGVASIPDPTKHTQQELRTKMAEQRRVEEARTAKKQGAVQDLMDYELWGEFLAPEPVTYRSSNFPKGAVVFDPQAPPSQERLKALMTHKPDLDWHKAKR